MQGRDSFGLTYSQSVNRSVKKELQSPPQQEELHQLSPNKQTMLDTYKENIMKPLETEQVISSLTSVQNENPTMPNPSNKDIDGKSEIDDQKLSLPSVKQIKKINSKSSQQHSFSNTKSKSKIPRTESLKVALTNKIIDAVDFLSGSIQLQKYCYGVDKVEDVILCFSDNLQFMSIYVKQKKRTDIVCMKQCTNITIGLKTQRFQYYFENNQIKDEEKCFSINVPSRSYDFVAKNKKYRDRIVNSINFLRQCLENNE